MAEVLAVRAWLIRATWVLIIGVAMAVHHHRVEDTDGTVLGAARARLADARRERDASMARHGQSATPSASNRGDRGGCSSSGPRDEPGGPVIVPLPEVGAVDLPLSKLAVVAGMRAVKPAVDQCYQTWRVPGVLLIRIVIDKLGRIVDARTFGRFGDTPTGRCVEAAVRTARFPRSAGLTLDYPLNLRASPP